MTTENDRSPGVRGSTGKTQACPGWPVGLREPNPILAAAVASLAGLGLVGAATLLTGRWRGMFLVWNLFLAWLPLAFAILAERPGLGRRARWVWAGLWLLFYPNAPYILTDLTHLDPGVDREFWVELCLVLLFAQTALVVGFLSLHRMQRLVTHYYGWGLGWGLVAAAAVLGATGVAIGRFLRWNSWDLLVRPWQLIVDLGGWLHALPRDRHTALFMALFSLFLFLSYVMVHNLAALADRGGDSSRGKP